METKDIKTKEEFEKFYQEYDEKSKKLDKVVEGEEAYKFFLSEKIAFEKQITELERTIKEMRKIILKPIQATRNKSIREWKKSSSKRHEELLKENGLPSYLEVHKLWKKWHPNHC